MTRLILNRNPGSLDVLHDNPREECNLDDSKGREYVDLATAAGLLQTGQARACGHCIGATAGRSTLDVQNHIGDRTPTTLQEAIMGDEELITDEAEEPTSEPEPADTDGDDEEDSDDEDE